MGSRAADTLREIEEIRARLDAKLGALESKVPLAKFGRRGAALLAGTGVLGSLLAARRVGSGRKAKKKDRGRGSAPEAVVVNAVPKGATAVAALGIAVWAGVRLYEAYTRSQRADRERGFRPAVVSMPDAEHRVSGN